MVQTRAAPPAPPPPPTQPVQQPASQPPRKGKKVKPQETAAADEAVEGDGAAGNGKPLKRPSKRGKPTKGNAADAPDDAAEDNGNAGNEDPPKPPPKRRPTRQHPADEPRDAAEGNGDGGDERPFKKTRKESALNAGQDEPQEELSGPTGWVPDLEHTNHGRDKRSGEILAAGQRAAIAEFVKQHVPHTDDTSVWTGVMSLGAGGFGAAFVYYSVDEDNLVKDRIVLKDTWIHDRRTWRDWTTWWGNPQSNDAKLQLEIKIMRDIADKAKDGRCVVHRGDTTWNDLFMYRVIMNYCPHGSLHEIIPNQVLVNKKPKNNGEAYGDFLDVPEPALWKWLEDMTKALQLMEEGFDPSDEIASVVGQRTIVHRDIKPANLFFDLPSGKDGDWPSYPIATLGDFGIAFYTHDDDPENPFAYNYWEGSNSYKPVELETFVHSGSKQPRNMGRLGSPTNVWGIGASFIRVMNCDSHPVGPYYLKPDDTMPTFNDNAVAVYSSQLRELLTRCVQFMPNRRITPAEILKAIASVTSGDGSETDLSQGMRTRAPTGQEANLKWPIWIREHYKIGFAADEWEAQVKQEETARDEADKQRKKEAAAAAKKKPKPKPKPKKNGKK